jgi:uncharacterized membrane protein
MSEARDQQLDKVVALSLRWGAYISFAILLTGLVSTTVLPVRTTYLIDLVGVVVMMSTPAFRVLIAVIVFFRERDYKYTLVATGVLLILLLGSIFGIGEH